MKRNLVVIAVIAVALGIMVRSSIRHLRTGGPQLSGNVQGSAAPDFALLDIKTGRTVHLSDFRGKAVLLNFWATWCPPCKTEIPWFEDMQEQYAADGLAVIGVAMDDNASPEALVKFSNDMGVNYLMLKGDEKVAAAYGGVEALPTTFYIGRDGSVVKRVFGLAPHGDIEQNVKLALSKGEQQAGSLQKTAGSGK